MKNPTLIYERGYFLNRKCYILEYLFNGEKKFLFKSKGIPKKFVTNEFI